MKKKKKDIFLNRIIEIDNEIKKYENDKNDKNKNKHKYDQLLESVLINSKTYWMPNIKSTKNVKNINSNSWFNIQETYSKKKNKTFNAKLKISNLESMTKCEKIKMQPNNKQRIILLNWMEAYIKMYNETLKLIKQRKLQHLPTITSWKTLRTSYLKEIKQDIIEKSEIEHLKYKTKVNSHVLDGAIQDACAKFKSCLTNLKRGHIKHFHLRYLKQSKDSKIIKIEKYFINNEKNTFCSSIFKNEFILKRKLNKKDIKNNSGNKYVDFKLSEINGDFTIHYNQKFNEFTLLNPIKIEQIKLHQNKDTIGLDPGIRKFQTGFSNNRCVQIGNNLKPKIKKYLNKIDKINNADVSLRIKKKVEKKCYKKIENAVDDMHWKSINYLTNNFGNILIGNLSTKSIVENNKRNNLDKMTKRVALLMKLHQFKQRLAYKCEQRKIGYSEIDEAYTSKTCTKCGCLKNDLGTKEVYKCNFCRNIIDRDYAGARNIFLKSLGN